MLASALRHAAGRGRRCFSELQRIGPEPVAEAGVDEGPTWVYRNRIRLFLGGSALLAASTTCGVWYYDEESRDYIEATAPVTSYIINQWLGIEPYDPWAGKERLGVGMIAEDRQTPMLVTTDNGARFGVMASPEETPEMIFTRVKGRSAEDVDIGGRVVDLETVDDPDPAYYGGLTEITTSTRFWVAPVEEMRRRDPAKSDPACLEELRRIERRTNAMRQCYEEQLKTMQPTFDEASARHMVACNQLGILQRAKQGLKEEMVKNGTGGRGGWLW